MGFFSINATDLKWINGSKDDPKDLCLHGHAIAVIGNRKLEYDATISATALYLLKSLTEDHIIYKDNQMLPCCGFSYIPNEKLDNVTILGCPNGIDWSIIHDGETVVLELEDGTKIRSQHHRTPEMSIVFRHIQRKGLFAESFPAVDFVTLY